MTSKNNEKYDDARLNDEALTPAAKQRWAERVAHGDFESRIVQRVLIELERQTGLDEGDQ